MKHFVLLTGVLGSVSGGCSGPGGSTDPTGVGSLDPGPGAPPTTRPAVTTGTGPFCEVQALMESRCRSCHTNPPLAGVPMALVTYDDLQAPATSDASKSVIQASLTRMRDTQAPMPPAPATPATAEEVALLEAWINDGMPSVCEPDASVSNPEGPTASMTNDYDTAVVCSSESRWTRGNEESANMRPGGECIGCHAGSGEGPRYTLAGTVYPTAHEPDDCNGAGGAQVVVIDANGVTITITPNSVGNFYTRSAIALPYQAKVVQDGRERIMLAAQEIGECNACHTEAGDNLAPGRVMLP